MTTIRERFTAVHIPRVELAARVPTPVKQRLQVATARLSGLFSTVTALGWGLLAVAASGAVAGVVLGWQELLVIAIGCLALVVLAVPFALGRSSYGVRLDLARDRVVVGERAVGSIEIANIARHGMLPARIELPVGSAFASFTVPRLEPADTHEELFTIPTAHRAVLVVGPVRSVRGDAIGVLRRTVTWTEPTDLYVHPRTISLDGASAGFLRDLEGLPTKELSNSDVSFHALREYVPGDDRRYVHWKSSARHGTLMVRQFEDTRRSHIAIGLASTVRADDDDFELAVSVTGSLGLQAIKEEKDVSVVFDGGPLRTATGKRLLDDLSGVQPSRSATDVESLARAIGQQVPGASVVLFVVGPDVTAGELKAASVHIPLGVRVIAVRCESGSTLRRRTVGDLVVLGIGDLTDLPRAMRSVAA